MKVLIVDDSNAMRMIIKRTLRQAGFENWTIEEASNGVEALANIQSTGPDLVLADWNMPEMSGFELLEQLRKIGTNVKFGFITSESTPEMKKKAEDAGALFLITKPFTADTFKEILSTVVA
jgi:two-component system, chemotaxis family, chemotaxis protein CheY